MECQVTQCLSAAEEKEWYMAVAAPEVKPYPKTENLMVFRIPPKTIVKLNRGTWHAGPLHEVQPAMEFYNLELTDTNVVDHTRHSYEDCQYTIQKL